MQDGLDLNKLIVGAIEHLGGHVRSDLMAELPLVHGNPERVRSLVEVLIEAAMASVGDAENALVVVTEYRQFEKQELPCFAGSATEPAGYVSMKISNVPTDIQLATPEVLEMTREEGVGLRVEREPAHGVELLFSTASEKWTGSGLVLVVDDLDAVRSVAANMLALMGFDAIEAEDGEIGIQQFNDHRDAVTAILLDYKMGARSSAEILDELYLIRGDVPVVVMSGYGEEVVAEEFAGRTFAGFLHKPFIMAELRKELRRILED